MKIFKDKKELNSFISKLKDEGKTIGLVPTMGALHEGHLSLIRKSQKKTDITVVSIFVNPTQFDNKEDLIKYPQPLNKDIELLKNIECNILYTPKAENIYDGIVASEKFNFNCLEHQMEGKFREGHFDGVATIVKKLLEITTPDIAFFGKKDFQQLQIIKKLVEQENIPVKIKGCPIHREKNDLAMSSRNSRLSKLHREEAPFIYKILKKAKKKFKTKSIKKINKWVVKEFKKNKLLKLEYFTIAEEKTLKTAAKKEKKEKYRAFIAVYAGDIRLIDNIKLN